MKKVLAALIALSLVASITPVQAAVKAGNKCTILGQKKSAGGKEFTCIKSGKKIVWNKGITKVSVPADLAPQLSPEKLATCQIKDQRPGSFSEAIAYPVTDFNRESKLPITGKAKVIFLPIDFSDVPGKGKPLDFGQSQIDAANEWLAWYTNGKLTYEWQTHNSWIRAPKPSTQYNWAHPVHGGYQGQAAPQAQSTEEIVQQLVTAASPHFNFEGVGAVFLLFPEETKAIEIEITQRNRPWQTAQGVQQFSFFGPGAEIIKRGDQLWGWWIHEVLHSHGLSGHFPFGFLSWHMMIGGVQSSALSSWDALITGWSNEEDVYCLSKTNLNKVNLTLSPIDRKQKGLKSVMVKLNDHQVVVFESRRPEKWSKHPYFNADGLMAYLVDTKVINDREGESSNQELTRTGRYLYVDGLVKSDDRFFKAPGGDSALIVAKQGESISYGGVKVTLVKKGTNDQIVLEKIS
jgi:hypothetical protein